MKHVSPEQATSHDNSNTCKVLEYGNNGTSDAAVIEINGRYPETDNARNKLARAVVYIVTGEGELTVEGVMRPIKARDALFLDPGEKYFFVGKFTMVMSCTPPWSSDQYEVVE